MKFKNYLFRTLLLGIIVLTGGGTMWADETIFSATLKGEYTVTAETTDGTFPSGKATFSGGTMYVTNGQTSDKKLISNATANKVKHLGFTFTNNNTFFKVVLNKALQAGDKIDALLVSADGTRGLWLSTATSRPSSCSTVVTTQQTSAKWVDGDTYTVSEGDGLCGESTFYIYRATANTTYFTSFKITRPVNPTAPVLTSSPASVSVKATVAGTAATSSFTLSGANLTPGTYNLSVPTVEGLSVSPTSFTVDADGTVSQQVSVSYSSAVNVGATSVTITSAGSGAELSVPVTYSAKVAPLVLAAVSTETIWDFSNGISGAKENSAGEQAVESVYDDIDGLTFTTAFNSMGLAFKGQYPFRDNSHKYAQNGTLHFKTTVPGFLVVKFSDTGSSASTTAVKRYLKINDETTEYWTSRENNGADNAYAARLNVTTDKIFVAEGDVTISGTSAITVSYIKFTPSVAANIAEFRALSDNVTAKLTLTNAKVTAKLNILNVELVTIEDATSAFMMENPGNLEVGQTLNGQLTAMKTPTTLFGDYCVLANNVVFNGSFDIQSGTAEATAVSVESLTPSEDVLRYVSLEGVTVTQTDDDTFYVNKGGQQFLVSGFANNISPNEIKNILNGVRNLDKIAGLLFYNGSSKSWQIAPMMSSDMVVSADQSLQQVPTIAAFKALADKEEAKLVLTDAYVTYSTNAEENRHFIFLEDASGALPISSTILNLQEGQKVNGSIALRFMKHPDGTNFMFAAFDIEGTNMDDLTITEEAFEPAEYDVTAIQNQEHLYKKVRIGRSSVTDGNMGNKAKELHTSSGNIYVSLKDPNGNDITLPEELAYIEGFVMVGTETVYYLMPSAFKEYEGGNSYEQGEKITDNGVVVSFGGDDTQGKKYEFADVAEAVNTFTQATSGISQWPLDANDLEYHPDRQNVPVKGTYYVFEPMGDGQLTVTVGLEAGKHLFVTEDGKSILTKSEDSDFAGAITFPVQSTKRYYVFATASNLQYFGCKLTPAVETEPGSSIADFKIQPENNGDGDILQLKDAVVNYVFGDEVYISDATGSIVVYQTKIHFEVGQVLNGYIIGQSGKLKKYIPALLNNDATKYGNFSVTGEVTPEAQLVSLADVLKKGALSSFVKLEELIVAKDDNGNTILTDGKNSIFVGNHFDVYYELNDTVKTIEAIVGIDAHGNYQLWPTSEEGVVSTKTIVPDTPVVPEPQPQDGKAVDYSWESPAGTAEEKGGMATYENGKAGENRVNYKNGDYYTLCLNGKKGNMNDAASANAGYILITLNEPLKGDETISITAYINKNSSAKSSAWIVYGNGTTQESAVYSDAENIHEDFGGAVTTTTLTVPAEAAGSKTLKLTRSQAGTNLFITKLTIKGQETVDETAGAELVHTASSSCGSDANTYVSTVDAEKEHVNNEKFNATWQGAAYAEFTFTVPAGEIVTNATLKFTAIGESRRARPAIVYVVNAGETLDYTAMAAGDAKVNLAGTKVADITFPHNTSERLEVDVTEAMNTIKAAGQNYIIFKVTGNPGGGDMVGKGSEDAPELVITSEAGVTGIETVNAPARTAEGVYTLSGQKVGDTTEGLKSGLYIVNGRKVVIK